MPSNYSKIRLSRIIVDCAFSGGYANNPTLRCSAVTLAAVVIGGSISYGRLAKEVNFAQVLLVQERKRSIWTLEKATRAECFYGIKPQSDPQCQ